MQAAASAASGGQRARVPRYLGQRASGGLQRVANNGGAALGGGPAAAEGIVGALEIDPLDDAPSEFRRRGAAPTVAPADVAPMDRKGR